MDPQTISPPPGAEDHAGYWAAVLAGAAGILAWLGKAFSRSGSASEPPEDPREARENRDATRHAITRIEEGLADLTRQVAEQARKEAEIHARAEAQREAMISKVDVLHCWLLDLSKRTGNLESQVAAQRAVDEDRKERKQR